MVSFLAHASSEKALIVPSAATENGALHGPMGMDGIPFSIPGLAGLLMLVRPIFSSFLHKSSLGAATAVPCTL